jgi:hypothetical protein
MDLRNVCKVAHSYSNPRTEFKINNYPPWKPKISNPDMKDLRFSQRWLWRMPSSALWRCVDLVWTDVSEERVAAIFRVEKSLSLLIQLGVFEWWLSLQPPAHAGSSLADFLPWRWRRYVPLKCRFTQDLHGSTSQKTAFFIVILTVHNRYYRKY